MIKAYVLIVSNPGTTRSVTTALGELDVVEELHEVMGPYDIVVELVVESLRDIPPILTDQIRSLEGVQSTTTLVGFPDE